MNSIHNKNVKITWFSHQETLQEIMVYFTRKLNQKPYILTFGHIGQINLNMSNLIGDFLTNQMVFLLVKSNNKIRQAKQSNF
jgi:hypothetical protein